MQKEPFQKEDRERIIASIHSAEKATSGEIRVHVEPSCKVEPMDRALEVFHHLNMHETKLRNGVLIYLAYDDRKFAILGDAGIHEKVGAHFWEAEKAGMLEHFKKGDLVTGICGAVKAVGDKLSLHFPYQSDDTNELSNEISFGGGQDA